MRTAPFALGYFVGDYEGLDNAGNVFTPLWVAANNGATANRTDARSSGPPDSGLRLPRRGGR